ncbi:MAG: hypothetical protein ABI904_03985 [Chloroflexota bacterium]
MRRSTVIVLLLAIILAGAYYFLNNREKPADIALTVTPEDAVAYLFSSSDGVPTSIRVESQAGEVVEIARNADNAWALTLPFEASAEQGSSEAAASQITTIRITDRLPNISPKDVGLDAPEYKLSMKFTNGVERIAQIGVVTPTENGYYASIDGKIVIVSKSSIDALIGLLTNPPYAETLTPSPIPATATETPLPSTPEAGTATNETATPKP